MVHEALAPSLPNRKGNMFIPGAGHWTPQERPDEVSTQLSGLLRGAALLE